MKALQEHTDNVKAGGDQRSRDQVMADTLVERITGQAQATDVNAELQIVMGLDALLDANNHTPTELAGYGPLPADLARDILVTSKGRLWWRRLYASTVGGPLAGGDPHRRNFDGYLRKLIMWRDRESRDPYCEAPIRHIDHIQRYTDGGLTIYPNGRGACERGNYVRETPGWKVKIITGGFGRAVPYHQDHNADRPQLLQPRTVIHRHPRTIVSGSLQRCNESVGRPCG
jgi:hypothetical protein